MAGSQQNIRTGVQGHAGGEQSGTSGSGAAAASAHGGGSGAGGAANSPYKVPRSVSAQAAPSGPKRRLSSGDQQQQVVVPPAVVGGTQGAQVAVVPGAVVLPAGAVISQGGSNVVPLRQNPRAIVASMGPSGHGKFTFSFCLCIHTHSTSSVGNCIRPTAHAKPARLSRMLGLGLEWD